MLYRDILLASCGPQFQFLSLKRQKWFGIKKCKIARVPFSVGLLAEEYLKGHQLFIFKTNIRLCSMFNVQCSWSNIAKEQLEVKRYTRYTLQMLLRGRWAQNMSRVGSSIQTLSEKFRLKSTLDSKFTLPSCLSEEFKDGPPSTEAGHYGAIPFRIPRQLLTSRLYTLGRPKKTCFLFSPLVSEKWVQLG